ncbi:MAG: Sua5 family C-terminal domain-containing protein, partial [Myxococcota bacterium]|nr:Sua5 family C-terminal domain-containing protein [Myxococcota bacterium]
HPVALRLLEAFGGALAAPSANRFGEVSPTRAEHVRQGLGDDLLVLDGGPCQVGIESSILDMTVDPPALLRPGGIAPEILEGLLGPLGASHTRASGTLPSHYAPRTALRVTDQPEEEAHHLEQQGLRVAVLHARPPAEYAQVLYAELRRLDAMGVDVLVAERVAEYGLGLAINDRLERASHSRDR